MLDRIQSVWKETINDYRLKLQDPGEFCSLRANIFGANLEKSGLKPLFIQINPSHNECIASQIYSLTPKNQIKTYNVVWKQHIVCGIREKKHGIIVLDPILFVGPETLDNWMKTLIFLKKARRVRKDDLIIRKFRDVDSCFFDNLDLFDRELLKMSPIKEDKRIFFPQATSFSR